MIGYLTWIEFRTSRSLRSAGKCIIPSNSGFGLAATGPNLAGRWLLGAEKIEGEKPDPGSAQLWLLTKSFFLSWWTFQIEVMILCIFTSRSSSMFKTWVKFRGFRGTSCFFLKIILTLPDYSLVPIRRYVPINRHALRHWTCTVPNDSHTSKLWKI